MQIQGPHVASQETQPGLPSEGGPAPWSAVSAEAVSVEPCYPNCCGCKWSIASDRGHVLLTTESGGGRLYGAALLAIFSAALGCSLYFNMCMFSCSYYLRQSPRKMRTQKQQVRIRITVPALKQCALCRGGREAACSCNSAWGKQAWEASAPKARLNYVRPCRKNKNDRKLTIGNEYSCWFIIYNWKCDL